MLRPGDSLYVKAILQNTEHPCHFAANNQEYKRFNGNSQVDERTLRELYLPAFETVVKNAQPETVMCSYPRINGVHASDNEWLLTDVLRKDWGVPFPVSWTVKMKKKQKETQDILSYHTQAAGCSDKARAKASGGRQPIEECGRTGL